MRRTSGRRPSSETHQPPGAAGGPEASAQRTSPASTPLPINPQTGQPYPPTAHPGFYPGYSTLAQRAFWDEATRTLVLNRVRNIPPIRFFQGAEVPLARAVFDRILPQDDHNEAHTIPVLNYVDEGYYLDRSDGYRYASMPPDREAIRLGLKGIEAVAWHLYGRSFTALAPHEQEAVLQTIHDGHPPAGDEFWRQLDVRIFWLQLVGRAAEAYYAHPWAWDEIGFGGPAYPRGYMRLEGGQPEPWEVAERRYPWAPPPGMPSATLRPYTAEYNIEEQPGREEVPRVPGQEGTH